VARRKVSIYETIVGDGFQVVLWSIGYFPRAYDGDGRPLRLFVNVMKEGKTYRAKSVDQFLAMLGRAGVDAAEFAAGHPLSMASALAWLENIGRLVVDHPLYHPCASDAAAFQRLLPRFDGGQLTWNVLACLEAGVTVVKRTYVPSFDMLDPNPNLPFLRLV
jgi:hypothetical protein